MILEMLNELVGKRHLLLEPGLIAPADPVVIGVLFKPLAVGLIDLLIQLIEPVLCQRLGEVDDMIHIDHAARARAALIIIVQSAPEERDLPAFCEGESTVFIFQKDTALRRDARRQGRKTLIVKNQITHGGSFRFAHAGIRRPGTGCLNFIIF